MALKPIITMVTFQSKLHTTRLIFVFKALIIPVQG